MTVSYKNHHGSTNTHNILLAKIWEKFGRCSWMPFKSVHYLLFFLMDLDSQILRNTGTKTQSSVCICSSESFRFAQNLETKSKNLAFTTVFASGQKILVAFAQGCAVPSAQRDLQHPARSLVLVPLEWTMN